MEGVTAGRREDVIGQRGGVEECGRGEDHDTNTACLWAEVYST
jgi:hypothetical protein